MTLRLKINLIVGVLTLLFLGIVLSLQLRSMHTAVREEVVAANRVTAQLLDRTVWLYAAQGTGGMLSFLQGVGRVRSNDIVLLDAQGGELYHSPASSYKAGREAPAWFTRLIAPAQAERSIAFPDGKLVVRSDASRAVLDAWDEAIMLCLAGLALLAAVNGGVFWLVGRTVRPFGRIVEALNRLQSGRFDVSLPRLPGTEAAAIGAAFNRMVGELRQHIEAERRAARAEAELHDKRELSRWVDRHVEEERRAIARELHDELGQSVTAMRSMALSIAQRVQALDPPSEQAARLIADEASRLYDAMHGIIPRLTPLVLDHFGLAEALNDLVERTRRSHASLRVDVQLALEDTPLGADAALALYRAAQEGMTNALRHGRASEIALTVRREGPELVLTVADNGSGLPEGWSARDGHFGLRWLAERLEGLGGRFSLSPAAPRGAQLQVHLPVPPAAAAATP